MTLVATERGTVSASRGVVDLDLTAPLPVVEQIPVLGARVLVRVSGRPLGYVDLDGRDNLIEAGRLATQIEQALGIDLLACSAEMPRTRPALQSTAHDITVVIATRDRPETLGTCIESLLAAEPQPAAIVIVDNAPTDEATSELISRRYGDHEQISYVREERPGLGRAHNAGLPSVRTSHVAFTDDDVVVDRGWVGAIAEAFTVTDDVACVTGLIAPAELVTSEQWWVERGAGFAKGFDRRVRSLKLRAHEGPLFPFDAGTLGSGANMAFSTAFLRELGGFDAALGTGTRALGGDDLAALHQVVARGHDLVYEPSAIVFHRHHDRLDALERQARGYGAGLTAYLTSVVAHRPGALIDIGRRLGPGLHRALGPRSPLNDRRPDDYPARLVWRERAGMVSGPWRYLRQVASDRRRNRSESGQR